MTEFMLYTYIVEKRYCGDDATGTVTVCGGHSGQILLGEQLKYEFTSSAQIFRVTIPAIWWSFLNC